MKKYFLDISIVCMFIMLLINYVFFPKVVITHLYFSMLFITYFIDMFLNNSKIKESNKK